MTSALRDPLWQRISAYQSDTAGDSLPFSKKLAQQLGWTADFTARAIAEYKRFIYLCCILPGGASPSHTVDEVWHLHLTYTVDYWHRFCRDTLGREVHHYPARGGGDEAQKHCDWYAETLRHYRATFGEAPPADIWPSPGASPEPAIKKGAHAFSTDILFLLLLPVVFIAVLYHQEVPFRLSGPHFLVFYALLAVCWAGIGLIIYHRLNRALGAVLSVLRITDAYEGAYLAGGTQRVQLMLIADGISRDVLRIQPSGHYAVAADVPGWAGYIGAPHIAMRETVPVSELKHAAGRIAAPYEAKYKGLKAASAVRWPLILLGIILPATGIIRMVQGIVNGKPIGFLLIMLFAATICCIALARFNLFHAMCARQLRHGAADAVAGITDDISRTVIFSGAAGLMMIPAYYHLERYFGEGRNGSGGDGGSSCGGSGCGGGGGGCGGCGGD